MIRVRVGDNSCAWSAAPRLNLIEYFLIRQRSLVNVRPVCSHTSDPTKAADISVGCLHHLHSEQSKVVEPVKFELKAILVRQLC